MSEKKRVLMVCLGKLFNVTHYHQITISVKIY